MSQLRISIDRRQKLFRLSTLRLLILFLIFTPLVYTTDGSQYRAFEVVIVGMLFLLIAVPKMYRLTLWIRSGTAYILAILLFIAVQPVFIAGASIVYNLKFAIVLFFCFIPTLYLSNCHPTRMQGTVDFVTNALWALFWICAISLFISAIAGVGEVYTEGGAFQQRAFAWLGDSFPPVMVFFLYFYYFRKNIIGVIVSATCLVVLMQAKMAIGMAALGCVSYLFLFGRRKTRILLASLLVLGVFYLPILFELLVKISHNFMYSLNNRLLSFSASFDFFWSSPWFGVGANQTFSLISEDFEVEKMDRYEIGMEYYEFLQIHNAFLRTLAELGLVGFMLFVAFCITIIRKSYFVLKSAYALPPNGSRALSMASALWLISFLLFHQTTGWFEPGHPQLSWLVCFLTLMNFTSRSDYSLVRSTQEVR